MSSVVRTVLGAALLLTGSSAAMAQSDSAPAGYQSAQTSTSATVVAANSAPAADQSGQTGAYSAIANQSPKPHNSGLCDKSDLYGGHSPASHWGTRAFWDGQSNTP
jgi:hypothetical protein